MKLCCLTESVKVSCQMSSVTCKKSRILCAGRRAHEANDQGRTVLDDVYMELLAARFAGADCQQLGYIMDGFPHTAAQA